MDDLQKDTPIVAQAQAQETPDHLVTVNGVEVKIPKSLIAPPQTGSFVSESGEVVSTLMITFIGKITIK